MLWEYDLITAQPQLGNPPLAIFLALWSLLLWFALDPLLASFLCLATSVSFSPVRPATLPLPRPRPLRPPLPLKPPLPRLLPSTSESSVPEAAGLALHAVGANSFWPPVKVENFASNLLICLGSLESISPQPSIASFVIPVSSASAILDLLLLVAASRSNSFGDDL